MVDDQWTSIRTEPHLRREGYIVTAPEAAPPEPTSALLGRMRVALGTMTLAYGGPAVDALHDLALEDIDQSTNPAAASLWLRQTDDALRLFAEKLSTILESGDRGTTDFPSMPLPAGGEARSHWSPRQLFFGDETLAIDVDRPGLHRSCELGRAGGSNLALLVDSVATLSSTRGLGDLGTPELLSIGNEFEERCFLQWPACAAAGGLRPQHDMDLWIEEFLCCRTLAEIRELAASIVDGLESFRANCSLISHRASLVHAIGREIASRHEEVALSAVGYDLKNGRMPLQFMAWDLTCRRGIVESVVEATGDDEAIARHAGPSFDVPASDVHRLHAAGADGRIDWIARAIVEAAPEGAAVVLSRLANSFETIVAIPTTSGTLRFYLKWQDGVITSGTVGRSLFGIQGSDLWIRETVPMTTVIAMHGRRLRELVELPFPCDGAIASITLHATAIEIKLDVDHALVNCVEGRIWDDAEVARSFPPAGVDLDEVAF